MTQLRSDAAYIRTKATAGKSRALSSFDEEVYGVLTSAHTVQSAAKTLATSESQVAASMRRLLDAERIELSPDS